MSKPSTSWLFKMAWRDSRRNLGRLLLFVSSIVIGIAALVAINSFSENLQADIDRQAQSLLGADFSVESNQPIPDSGQICINGKFPKNRRHSTFTHHRIGRRISLLRKNDYRTSQCCN